MKSQASRLAVACLTATTLAASSCTQPNEFSGRMPQSRHGFASTEPSPFDVKEDAPPKILPVTHLAAGQLFEQQGLFGKALDQYRKAVAVNHKYSVAYNRLGVLLDRMGRHRDAEQALRKAVALDPQSPYFHNNLGFSLLLQQRWADAEGEFRAVLDIKPDYARARVNLGIVLARMDRFDEAFDAFAEVLPTTDAYYNLGLLYRGAKRYHRAADAFEQVLALKPDFQAARKQLEQITPHLTPPPAGIIDAAAMTTTIEAQSPPEAGAPAPLTVATTQPGVTNTGKVGASTDHLTSIDGTPGEYPTAGDAGPMTDIVAVPPSSGPPSTDGIAVDTGATEDAVARDDDAIVLSPTDRSPGAPTEGPGEAASEPDHGMAGGDAAPTIDTTARESDLVRTDVSPSDNAIDRAREILQRYVYAVTIAPPETIESEATDSGDQEKAAVVGPYTAQGQGPPIYDPSAPAPAYVYQTPPLAVVESTTAPVIENADAMHDAVTTAIGADDDPATPDQAMADRDIDSLEVERVAPTIVADTSAATESSPRATPTTIVEESSADAGTARLVSIDPDTASETNVSDGTNGNTDNDVAPRRVVEIIVEPTTETDCDDDTANAESPATVDESETEGEMWPETADDTEAMTADIQVVELVIAPPATGQVLSDIEQDAPRTDIGSSDEEVPLDNDRPTLEPSTVEGDGGKHGEAPVHTPVASSEWEETDGPATSDLAEGITIGTDRSDLEVMAGEMEPLTPRSPRAASDGSLTTDPWEGLYNATITGTSPTSPMAVRHRSDPTSGPGEAEAIEDEQRMNVYRISIAPPMLTFDGIYTGTATMWLPITEWMKVWSMTSGQVNSAGAHTDHNSELPQADSESEQQPPIR